MMEKWKALGVVKEGERINIGGVNPWNHRWLDVEREPVMLPHPSYLNQRHSMIVYKIVTAQTEIIFAAGELSAGVWGFYILGL